MEEPETICQIDMNEGFEGATELRGLRDRAGERGNHLWGIVLAGGEGKRLQPYIRRRYGEERPKQYCAFVGGRSMLRHTIDRAQMLIPRERLLTIVSRSHNGYVADQLHDQAPENIIVQPFCRETGPGVLLPLLHIVRRDPLSVIALFPSDHFILEEDRFMGFVKRASEFVQENRHYLVVLGVEPDRPEAEYGWMIKGGEVLRDGENTFYRVRRFLEKPTGYTSRDLLQSEYLWSTMVIVGASSTLLRAYQGLVPMVCRLFSRTGLGAGPKDTDTSLDDLFASLPSFSFSRHLLERIPENLCALKVTGVRWS